MTQQSSSNRDQFSRATEGTPTAQHTAADTTQKLKDQVKEAAEQATDQAQETASKVADQAREQVSSRLAGQKDNFVGGLNSVAEALRQTGQQLRQQDQQGVTDYIDRAASQVERASSYLQERDLGQLVDDVEQFARRQPTLFLGGAFALGLLGARFLKSSRPATSAPATNARPYPYKVHIDH
jgi:hypothetical protein